MSLKLRDLPKAEKPRERLLKLGANALSMAELLQIILVQGNKQGSVEEICARIQTSYKCWGDLANAPAEQLAAVKGLGLVRAVQIKAAFEFGNRFYQEFEEPKSKAILNSESAYRMCRRFLKNKKKEHLLLFCLDVRGRLLANPETVSIGILDCSLVHPREIFSSAISLRASRILLAHNHPSGSEQPSDADIEVTRQVYLSSEIIGIPLIDHLVVGKNYTSIREYAPNVFSSR